MKLVLQWSHELLTAEDRTTAGATIQFADLAAARAFLRRFSSDPLALGVIRRVVRSERTAQVPARDPGEVLERLAWLILQRRVLVRVLPRASLPSLPQDDPTPPSRTPSLEPLAKKAWIELELLDHQGQPASGERYWIRHTDGEVRTGKLGANGMVRFDGLEPGTCLVKFPDVGGEIAPVEVDPGVPGRAWIELELLDHQGRAVAGAPYWIKLPDGKIREGALDESGFVRFDDLDPGSCLVRWPGQPEGAFELAPTKSAAGASGDTPASPPAAKRAWIELELLDHQDQPVPGAPYWIRLPDGKERQGELDGSGLLRLDGIPPGVCRVWFPGLQSEAEVPATEADPGRNDAWLELELLDHQGKPVADQPFVVKLPDGGEKTGALDGNGLARLKGLSPGECQVRFPELPAELESPSA